VSGVVQECSDDKSLAKDERKRQQIVHAPHASHQAKLVKLADKYHNLRDLAINPPTSWDAERVQGYFCWSHAVVTALKGTHEGLEAKLQELFTMRIVPEGKESYSVLVPEPEREAFLNKYYDSMKVARD